MNCNKALEIAERINNTYDFIKAEAIQPKGHSAQYWAVRIIVKDWDISASGLDFLSTVVGKENINLGRSGPNFRMTIG